MNLFLGFHRRSRPDHLFSSPGSRGDQQPRRHLEVPGCRWGSTRGHQPQIGKVITGEEDDDDDEEEEDEEDDEMFLSALMFAFNLYTIIIHI